MEAFGSSRRGFSIDTLLGVCTLPEVEKLGVVVRPTWSPVLAEARSGPPHGALLLFGRLTLVFELRHVHIRKLTVF